MDDIKMKPSASKLGSVGFRMIDELDMIWKEVVVD
jgi:hypothetical protein